MSYIQFLPKLLSSRIIPVLIAGFTFHFLAIPVVSQAQDPFDDLNKANSNEFTLEIETEDSVEAEPRNLIQVDPVIMVINKKLLSGIRPDLADSKLVHAKTYQSGAQIPQGSQLLFKLGYHAAKGTKIKRRAMLFSQLSNPENPLDEDALFEMGGPEKNAIKWRPHSSQYDFAAVATINNHIQKGRRAANAPPRLREHDDFYRYVFLETAKLKPGNYMFRLRVYRKEGQQVAETVGQNYIFTVVEAPIHAAVFMPSTIKTYKGPGSAATVVFAAAMSDWAVTPYSARLESSLPGFALWYDGRTFEDDMGESVFTVVARPKPNLAGRTASLTLTVTDGLGRTGTLKRQIRIVDGRNSEIQVSMPGSVNAGQTINGTVIYPAGFILKKPPVIGDRRGFSWTNSDYTAFSIRPNEEGVDHKRLFAIVASGTMDGMDEDPVLVWKREFSVKSQDLIYDEARNRQRTEANNRAWREALGSIASGIGDAANAYEDAQSGTSQGGASGTYSKSSNSEQGYGGYSSEDVSKIWERVQGPSTSSAVTQSAGSGASLQRRSSGSIVAPEGISGQLDFSNGQPTNICGIDNRANEWRVTWDSLTYSDRFVPEVGVPDTIGNPNAKVHEIALEKRKPESGTTRHKTISFYAKNCVMKHEYIPRLDEYTVITYWDNGGKKKVDISDGKTTEWDRQGNLIQ